MLLLKVEQGLRSQHVDVGLMVVHQLVNQDLEYDESYPLLGEVITEIELVQRNLEYFALTFGLANRKREL